MKKKKAGRPKIKIDWKEFDKLCAFQCTLFEISNWFGCSEDTIERRCQDEKGLLFKEYFKKKAVSGKISLRRAQFKAANEGNPTLLIWLGKQYLGQKETIMNEISGPDGKPIETKISLKNLEAELKKKGIPVPQIETKDLEE